MFRDWMKSFTPWVLYMLIKADVGLSKSLFAEDGFVHDLQTPLELISFVTDGIKLEGSCGAGSSRLLMLYADWCPHCHSFAPFWSSVGQRTKCKMNDGFKMGAFECTGDGGDRAVSDDKWKSSRGSYFHEDSVAGKPRSVLPQHLCRPLASAFPTLLAITEKGCDLGSVSALTAKKNVGGFWESLMDHSGLSVYQLRLNSSMSVVDDMVRVLQEGHLASDCRLTSTGGPLSEQEEDHEAGIKVKLEHYLENYKSSHKPAERLAAPSANASSRWVDGAQVVDPQKRFKDAVLGLYHILSSWVFSDSHRLTEDKVVALKNLLRLGVGAFPEEEDKRRLGKLLLEYSDEEMLKVDESWYKESLKGLEVGGVAWPEDVHDLRKSSELCSSTSCNIWTLFHVLAANIYDTFAGGEKLECFGIFNSPPINDKKNDEALVQELKQVMEGKEQWNNLCIEGSQLPVIMHQVIYEFFNCITCRSHFHEAYEECAADRCEWTRGNFTSSFGSSEASSSGTLLWLWRFHNVVNVRTATDRSLGGLRNHFDKVSADDQEFPLILYDNEDVRMPTLEMCKECRTADSAPLHRINSTWLAAFVKANGTENAVNYDHYKDFNLTAVRDWLLTFYLVPTGPLLQPQTGPTTLNLQAVNIHSDYQEQIPTVQKPTTLSITIPVFPHLRRRQSAVTTTSTWTVQNAIFVAAFALLFASSRIYHSIRRRRVYNALSATRLN